MKKNYYIIIFFMSFIFYSCNKNIEITNKNNNIENIEDNYNIVKTNPNIYSNNEYTYIFDNIAWNKNNNLINNSIYTIDIFNK